MGMAVTNHHYANLSYLLMSFISRLPESARWLISKSKEETAKKSLETIYSKEDAQSKLKELQDAQENEANGKVGYKDMLLPGGPQFHPTMVTVMGQINQALTGTSLSPYQPKPKLTANPSGYG